MRAYYKKGGSVKTAAWQRKEGKSESGGLNKKGVASYRRENPGSKLKTAVTTKPSKLKKGSKAANRRKSFCSRMGGMKKKLTSKKTASDPDSRINKALRKWNCSTDVIRGARLALAERILEAFEPDAETRHARTSALQQARLQGKGKPRSVLRQARDDRRAGKARRAAGAAAQRDRFEEHVAAGGDPKNA